jgi:hypothetical protein
LFIPVRPQFSPHNAHHLGDADGVTTALNGGT